MSVRDDTDGSLLLAVTTAARAVVFLSVPWSCPARAACVTFESAAGLLAAECPALGIECLMLDEEADWCQAWLAGLGLPPLGNGHPLGAGSIIWLERGRAVSHELGGYTLQARGVVARSRWLWAS
jgi:hypothetical protein